MSNFNPDFDLANLPKGVQDNFDLWNGAAEASKPDSENFDEFTRAYAVFGLAKVSQETTAFMKTIADKMMDKKYKARIAPSRGDQLATFVEQDLPKLKEVYKPYAAFGDPVDEKWLKSAKTTYAAHAIATWIFNDYAKKLSLKAPSQIKRKIEELEKDTTIDNATKYLKIAKLRNDRATEDNGTATFQTQPNFIRGLRALCINVILGPDCLEPAKFVVIDTPDGATTIEGVTDEDSRYLLLVIHACNLLEIPLFNIGSSDGQDAVNKFIDELK